MNRSRVHWLVGDGLPEHSAVLEAVPGVGNVGKILVDSLVEKHPSRTLGWILNHDFPPHSTFDSNGLMRPPRMEIKSVILPDGQTVIVIGGEMQPMTSAGQNEVAEEILTICSESSTPMLLVLAGLASGAEDKGIHVICADEDVRRDLVANDIPVSKERPEAGMIGVAGLIVSMSPLFGVNTFALVAETVGSTTDVLAASRLANWIENGLDLPLDLDIDSTEEIARKLMEGYEGSISLEEAMGLEEASQTSDFYV
jgi:proteasome assembly chaperone (PAC2) family protein